MIFSWTVSFWTREKKTQVSPIFPPMTEIGVGEPVTLAFLKAKRTQYRCTRVTGVVFMPYRGPTRIPGANVNRSYPVTFHALKDMPLGAVSVDEYEPHAREVILNLMHGFCLRTDHTEPIKPLAHKQSRLAVKGDLTLEFLISEPDRPEDNAYNGQVGDKRRIVAHKYRFNFYANAEAIHYAAQMAYNQAAGLPLGTPAPFGQEESVAKWEPLNDAIRLGTDDNAVLMDKIQKCLAKRDRPTNTEAGCLAQTDNFLTLPMYSYVRQTRLDQFHTNTIMRYLGVHDTVSTDMYNVPPGRLYDPRHFANVTTNTFQAGDIYKNPLCEVSARHVFGSTTSFAYHSVDNVSLKQTICAEQVDPTSYNPERMDIPLDDSLAHSTNPDAVAIYNLPPYQKLIVDLIGRQSSDVDEMLMPERFPFPKLVFNIHAHVWCPAVFSMVHMPLVIGAQVTPHILEHGRHPISVKEVALQLGAVAKLQKIEAEPFGHGGPHHYDYEDYERESLELFVGAVTTDKGRTIADYQNEVVDAAISEIHGLANARDRPLLFSAVYGRFKNSTHAAMHMDDFLWLNTRQGRSSLGNEEESALFVRERLRKVIRDDIRASMNLDFSFTERFDRVRSLTGDTLAVVESEERVQREEEIVSRTGSDYAMSRVDRTNPKLRELDDFLKLRMDYQCTNLMRHIRAYGRFSELTTEAQRKTFYKEFSDQTFRHYRNCIGTVISMLRENDNIPWSLMTTEFRDYYNTVCTPEGLRRIFDSKPQYDYDATPFTACMQQLRDLMTDVHKTSPTTLNPGELLFFVCMDGFTWEYRRLNPATNFIAAAATGIGKSFLAELMKLLFPPGVCLPLTTVSKQVFNQSKSYDALFMIFSEMKAAWMGLQSKEAKEAGASEEVNFLKARLTDFVTSAERTVKDPKTGKGSVESSIASHHNVVIGFTNQNMVFLDVAVRRRFIVLFIPRNLRVPSMDPDTVSDFYSKSVNKVLYERVRATTALFVTIACCIKADALPTPVLTSLGIWIKRVSEVAKEQGMSYIFEGTNMHYITQLTIKIQLYYACWYALNTPEAALFHAEPGAPEPWSPDAILQLVGANMAANKASFIYAMGLMENVITPVYITRILKDILLEGIQIGKGKLRVRRTDVADRGIVSPDHDYAYLCLCDRSKHSLFTTIQKLSKDWEMRVEEIEFFFTELAQKRMPSKYKFSGKIDEDGLAYDVRAEKIPKGSTYGFVPQVILEVDETPNRRRGYRICLFIPYLEKLFGIKIANNDNLVLVDTQLRSTDVQVMVHEECTAAFIMKHMQITAKNSPLMDIVRKAMECDVLEKFPAERPGAPLNPVLCRYITPLQPEPIILVRANVKRQQMVLLHATGRQLQLKRTKNPMSKIMMPDFSQPTSERTLKRVRDSEQIRDVRGEMLRKASTLTATLCDPDYTAAREMVQSLGLPVSPLVRKAYGEKIATESDIILPLGFMPISYFVCRWISRETKTDKNFLIYPLDNVRAKINNAQKRLQGIDSNEISNDHVDIELMSGTATIGGVTFSIPAVSETSWATYREGMDNLGQELVAKEFDWFYPTIVPEEDPDAMDIG